jgi:hypothetical protein
VRQTRFPVLLGTLAAFAAVPSATAQTTVTLAKPTVESAESFTRISSIRELPTGKVLLVDQQDKVVHLVDLAAGSMIKVGREGQGPGEYTFPAGLFGLPTGETLLYDVAGRRFLTISPEGKPIGILEMPRPPVPHGGGPAGGPQILGFGFNDVRGVDAQGRLYFQGSPFLPGGTTADSVPIMRWDRVSTGLDTVGYLTVPAGSASASGGAGRLQVRIGGGKVWTPTETWDVAGDGRVARVVPAPYRVIWIGSGKATPGPVQPYTPIRVTEAEKALYKDNARRAPRNVISIGPGGTRSTAAPNIPQEEPEFAETMPPFTGRGSVAATPDGEVWVLRTRSASDKVPVYDVFDKTGTLVKKVSLNPNSRVVGFGKGTVYVARTDDDDLQWLQRYKRP